MTCEKCGASEISKRYHSSSDMCHKDFFSKRSGEHLHYFCDECGYDWTEDTKDKCETCEDCEEIDKYFGRGIDPIMYPIVSNRNWGSIKDRVGLPIPEGPQC